MFQHVNCAVTYNKNNNGEDTDMLDKWTKPERPDEAEINEGIEAVRKRLVDIQLQVKEKKLPVLVVLEGWDAAGKGSVLGKVIKDLDPRFFDVRTMDKPSEDELRRPFMYKYFAQIPEAGKFVFLEGGWMDELNTALLKETISKEEYDRRCHSVECFERQLVDNGYLLIKFFFHISKKEQRKRMDVLLEDKNTSWRVTDKDKWQNRNYEKCFEQFDSFMERSEDGRTPWHIIDAKHQKWAQLELMSVMLEEIDERLEAGVMEAKIPENVFKLKSMPMLSEIELDKEMDVNEYRRELVKCQKKLSKLHNELYRKKIPVVIAYEGWDAAGKGGNIKRIAGALDPRGYDVHPIASPEPHEKSRHYLWRFWTRLPKTGHIGIFDRTWYGRVMVERLEGFCSKNDWQRAYNEINEFEKELKDWGAVIIKFWVQIDKDTQLNRFKDRENTPQKRWKITDEDWRNREKWDLYEDAVNEMIQKTSTDFAPWYILESNNKYYARIKALKIVIKELEKALSR